MDRRAWQERFAGKVTTAEVAIRVISRGRRILIGSGAAEPVTLVEAMIRHGQHLADNEVVHLLTLGPAPYVAPGLEARFRHTAFFIGEKVRAAVQEGRADFMPVFLHPWEEEHEAQLPAGERVWIRPVRMTDEELLQDLFSRLSDESTHQRFMSYKRAHPHEDMAELVNLEAEDSVGIVVCADEDGRLIVAMARYDVDPATNLADIAFVVQDEWQGRGVGTLLMKSMAELARARGLSGFTADVEAANKPMMMVLHRSGLEVKASLVGGAYHLVARFPGAEVTE